MYASGDIGEKLANGDLSDISSAIINNVWLAMYSYNSVEGEYFDSNPGEYLGLN